MEKQDTENTATSGDSAQGMPALVIVDGPTGKPISDPVELAKFMYPASSKPTPSDASVSDEPDEEAAESKKRKIDATASTTASSASGTTTTSADASTSSGTQANKSRPTGLRVGRMRYGMTPFGPGFIVDVVQDDDDEKKDAKESTDIETGRCPIHGTVHRPKKMAKTDSANTATTTTEKKQSEQPSGEDEISRFPSFLDHVFSDTIRSDFERQWQDRSVRTSNDTSSLPYAISGIDLKASLIVHAVRNKSAGGLQALQTLFANESNLFNSERVNIHCL